MGKETLNEFVTRHPLARLMRELKADVVSERFSDWLKSKPSDNSWLYSLYDFANNAPFCYVDDQIINETLSILSMDTQCTLDALKNHGEYVSRAIFTSFRPSVSWQIQDGEKFSIDTPKGIEDFENIWHPEYVKCCEQIYNHLIKIPLHILGKQNSRDFVSLGLPKRIEKLIALGYSNLTNGYDSVIRNAISHGGIEYGISDISYIDILNKKDIYAPDLVSLLDDLLDTCNSMIVSFLLFIIANQDTVEKTGIENLPLGIKYLLTKGFTSHNGLKIISFMESGLNKQQLNINIQTSTMYRGIHQFEALQVAWAASFFGGSNFERILVNIDCDMPVQPLAIINGKLLNDAIKNKLAFEEVVPKLFEHSLLWYDTTKLRSTLFGLQNSMKTSFEIQKESFANEC
ncbi:MAG: hypothetical protein QM730_19835 [Anaerolineales bacterium]